ncbi:hypothetical protein NEUTE1DRAFT_117180 [Neurospora tetrasperma FGSC 2508]|uniref:Uncharacterized protein n=1 Tax=Neurospora tetrasperma (strain FGSC 2508 / ATCC MYA-4615 / P0657) TaxID=510951 RepID=F8MM00_NEUT8|nr:uncharacterized protein NEUTE1DRAFT_117180 [Neurospora tetrasperma FGSC 2508]EGO58515.1 hypothetical protein NEUTE1DRAFT_117180 [Neurospora tetrasperma FGSC 2508]EGZ71144.1 hypothetical protein NEUTE2DRAFT_144429 [Neurospora tetrasperma FGSC 2509]
MAGEPASSMTTPQVATDQQPVSDDKSLSDIRRSMKRDGQGISALGLDGVFRSFDAERNVLDAVGLNPAQIREYYDGLPLPERLRTADGRNVSRWDMFHPDAENVPKIFTEEEKARMLAHNEEMVKRGVTCATCVPGKSVDERGLKA